MYVFYKGMAGSNKATGATFGATFDLPEQLSLVALVAFWEQLVDGPSRGHGILRVDACPMWIKNLRPARKNCVQGHFQCTNVDALSQRQTLPRSDARFRYSNESSYFSRVIFAK